MWKTVRRIRILILRFTGLKILWSHPTYATYQTHISVNNIMSCRTVYLVYIILACYYQTAIKYFFSKFQEKNYCFISLHRIFPESARWLAAKGHLNQAHAVLMKYASKSSLSVDSDGLKSKLTECYHSELESKVITSGRKLFLDLFRTPRLRKRTAILCLNW